MLSNTNNNQPLPPSKSKSTENEANLLLYEIFKIYDKKYFYGTLTGNVEVRWSKRMTLCAGCTRESYEQKPCSISLSRPLMELRPLEDLLETLVHEMIHAYIFISGIDEREEHGPSFYAEMDRIEKLTGMKLEVFHEFISECNHLRNHVWICNGPCIKSESKYSIICRSMNRPPSMKEKWFQSHSTTCGGTFIKIRAPSGEKSEFDPQIERKLKIYMSEITKLPNEAGILKEDIDYIPLFQTKETAGNLIGNYIKPITPPSSVFSYSGSDFDSDLELSFSEELWDCQSGYSESPENSSDEMFGKRNFDEILKKSTKTASENTETQTKFLLSPINNRAPSFYVTTQSKSLTLPRKNKDTKSIISQARASTQPKNRSPKEPETQTKTPSPTEKKPPKKSKTPSSTTKKRTKSVTSKTRTSTKPINKPRKKSETPAKTPSPTDKKPPKKSKTPSSTTKKRTKSVTSKTRTSTKPINKPRKKSETPAKAPSPTDKKPPRQSETRAKTPSSMTKKRTKSVTSKTRTSTKPKDKPRKKSETPKTPSPTDKKPIKNTKAPTKFPLLKKGRPKSKTNAATSETSKKKKYIWQCSGLCQSEAPIYGRVERLINRPPSKREKWFVLHEKTCGGTFERID